MSGQELVQNWLKSANNANPAGSLFVSGKFAEADIVNQTNNETITGWCGSACTWSATRECC